MILEYLSARRTISSVLAIRCPVRVTESTPFNVPSLEMIGIAYTEPGEPDDGAGQLRSVATPDRFPVHLGNPGRRTSQRPPLDQRHQLRRYPPTPGPVRP